MTAFANPYMYTGRRYDPETGLYYYRARMYSPTLGRFLQPDLIGYADGSRNQVSILFASGLLVPGRFGVRGR
ncbi:RHS repeat-associated core domain-containing protein [Anaerohalosphaera lusitana]|uniref:RHS repeat-associated core domain-containing protein n=1 Tax=Anaerohalosphaera lusitana TaxID=1936003 RepID=UPI003AAE2A0F